VVTAGRGAVQTLTAGDPPTAEGSTGGGFETTPLEPGALVWFTPGTIHRLVNQDGLRIVVLMQNNGLPEAGDAVLTLPPRYRRRPADVRASRPYPRRDRARAGRRGPATARPRRRGLHRAACGRGARRSGAAAGVHRAAAALVRPRLADWRARWETGAAEAARQTGAQLDRLAAGDSSHLAEARLRSRLPEVRGGFGMCGRLDTYDVRDGRAARPRSS